MKFWLDIAGWIGSAQILSMYLLLSFDYIKPRKFYHFFNFTGGAFVCIICVINQVWQAAVVEGIWSIMAFFFLMRIIFFSNPERRRMISMFDGNNYPNLELAKEAAKTSVSGTVTIRDIKYDGN